MEDKKLIVKFEVTAEIDTSNMEGDTFEEKLENWKRQVDFQLFDSLDHWGEVYFKVNCIEEKIKDYE